MKRLRKLRRNTTIVINVSEEDTLDRISLMNTTLINLVAGKGLVEVCEADYRRGHMEVVVQRPPTNVTDDARVAVHTH